MALPHLAHQKRYQDFYQTRSRKKDWIILDNGAAEDVTFGPKHLLTMADVIGANEVVAPDVLFDYNETIAKTMYFSRFADPKFRYMGVVQGTKFGEFLACMRAYAELVPLNYITTIGVPRLMATVCDDPDARVKFMRYVQREGFDASLEFHMLGATDDLEEVKRLTEFGNLVRGIDTSAPIYMGLLGKDIEEEYVARPEEFDMMQQTKHMNVLTNNIDKYLMWAEYEYHAPSS